MEKSSRIFLVFLFISSQILASGCRPNLPAAQATVRSDTTPLQPSALPPVPSPTNTATPELADELLPLKGLPFDQFLDESFKLLLLRDPEGLTSEGLSERFGVDDTRLTDLSEAYIRETQDLQKGMLDLLLTYDRTGLDREQQISYDTYLWYLDDLVCQQEFADYDYPVNQTLVNSVQGVTEYLFTDIQPVYDEASARAYIQRLGQLDEKFNQLIEGLKRRQQAGVVPPRLILEWSIRNIRGMADTPARATSFYKTFRNKLMQVKAITPEQKTALLEAAVEQVEQSVLPAYKVLGDFISSQLLVAPVDPGVWQYPQGEAYYRYALRHHTTTSLSPDDIHQLGMQELERIHTEIRERFDQLGYAQDSSLLDLFYRVGYEGGELDGTQVLDNYQELLEQADKNLSVAFDLRPEAKLEVRSILEGNAFYNPPSLDGTRPGIFYAPIGDRESRYLMPSLSYHEGIPGHHFQVALARELDLPITRGMFQFNAYAEGWALYAERLAADLGWYENDPYGDLGRLQYEAFRAARLVADTGIHAKKWSFDQAVDFMVEQTGLPYDFMEYEVARYIAWPGQACSYSIGFLKLLELRRIAQERLGEDYDMKAFHRMVLSHGGLPLELLEQIFQEDLSLASLKKISDFPLYSMRYAGDYGFGKHLQDLKDQLSSNATTLVYPGITEPAFACTGFTARTQQGERLLGRNFDWYRHPALLLFTDPPDGYASASMVDISYLGFAGPIEQDDPAALSELLEAPYLPFDGMNERGLAVGMMAVPHSEGGNDPGKATLDDLEAIRLLLDYAADVDQAIELLGQYNVVWGSGPAIHYLLADAAGNSAVVEYIGGKPQVFRSQQPWQISTNFLFAEVPLARAGEECWRYKKVDTTLSQSQGLLSAEAAMGLLKNVSQTGTTGTIWSVVYNLSRGQVQVVMDRDYEQVYSFELRR